MTEILVKCAWCGGTGKGSEDRPTCIVCKGSGLIKVVTSEDNKPIRCVRCGGIGKNPGSAATCTECGGSGWAGWVRKVKKPESDSTKNKSGL